jgi:MFS family permease
VARSKGGQPRGWFTKSGHTTHRSPAKSPPAGPPITYQPPPPPRRSEDDRYPDDRYEDRRRYDDRYDEPTRYRRSADDRDYDRRYDERERDRRYDDRDDRRYDDRERDRRYDERDHDDRRYPPRRYEDRDYDRRYDDRTPPYDDPYGQPRYAGRRYDDDDRPPSSRARTPRPGESADKAGAPTVARAALTLGRATVSSTNRAARTVTRRVIRASKSDGAHESGLTALIWNQVLSYGTDAMVTVALAGTVFFGASADAKRGNVLLYLLITMAPFALVAPVIGPILDRFQHGRRWTMAGTAIGRAVLALIMAGHSTDLLILYPCALGSLVLSKAYGVVRASAAPRLVPAGMTLSSANARLTIFGLGSTVVLGGVVGVLIKLTGSYSFGLIVTAVGFAACGYFAFSLPKQVDSASRAPRHPQEPPRPSSQPRVPPMGRLLSWARRGFQPHVVVALQGESVLRMLSGLLTIYLAFYVESTAHGVTGALELSAMIGAAGVGNFVGTAIGTRAAMARPELLIVASTVIVTGTCVLVAITFSVPFAAVGMFIAYVGNSLGKVALDSLIQHDVVETLRSSAFGRSETFLQLAWVVGAAIGVLLPSSKGDGYSGFLVGAVVVGTVALVVVGRNRAARRAEARESNMPRPRSLD